MKRMVLMLALVGLLGLAGCVTVTPEELGAFKGKAAIVHEMSAKCATDPAACCPALAEAARAMDTIITACED